MSAKKIIKGKTARKELVKGINTLADAVGSTLGPGGRNAVFRTGSMGMTVSTRDGVTVANHISLGNPEQDMIIQYVKEAAARVDEVAGDATTTTTILTAEVINRAIKEIDSPFSKVNIREFKQGMEAAAADILENLEKFAQPISDKELSVLENIATISASDPSIGAVVAQAYLQVGRDGIVTFKPSTGTETLIEVESGFSVPSGYESQAFVNNPSKMTTEFEDVNVLVTDYMLFSIPDILKATELLHSLGKPFIIFCKSCEGEALEFLIHNAIKKDNPIRCVVVRAPAGPFGEEYFQNVAKYTGASIISEANGASLQKLAAPALGSCKKVVVNSEKTSFVGGNFEHESFKSYCEELLERANNLEDPDMAKALKSRVASLNASASVIKIGGESRAGKIEKTFRYEDAVNAVRAALDHGVVPGGGTVLIKSAHQLKKPKGTKSFNKGYDVVLKACEAPFNRIVKNAALNFSVSQALKLLSNEVFDCRTGKVSNMYQAGVIDPYIAPKMALTTAVEIATVVITTETLIFDDYDYLKR